MGPSARVQHGKGPVVSHFEKNILIFALFVGIFGILIYNVPSPGDTQMRDGVVKEYRCNWAGCGWFNPRRGT